MALKQVEMVRKRIAGGLANEIVRWRSFLSTVDGNSEAVDLLRERNAEELLAVLVENTLTHLGHDTALSAMAEKKDRASQARKASRRFA